jgi:small basic protein
MKGGVRKGNELGWIQVMTYLTQRIDYRAFLALASFGVWATFGGLRGHLSYHFNYALVHSEFCTNTDFAVFI